MHLASGYGYMDGALETGRREADRILRLLFSGCPAGQGHAEGPFKSEQSRWV